MGNHGAFPEEALEERAADPLVDAQAEADVSAIPDDELVRRAQADPETFGLLYERYHREIHGFILSRVRGNPDVAQDLTSQVFTRAFSARFVDGSTRSRGTRLSTATGGNAPLPP